MLVLKRCCGPVVQRNIELLLRLARSFNNLLICQALTSAIAQPESALVEDQVSAIKGIEKAIDIYLCANASPEQPWDMTSRIVNPSFETGDLTGWTITGMSLQGNDVFNIKQGTYYVERWTWRGNTVGDAHLSQRLSNMPAGRYRLTAAAQNIQEDTPSTKQTGASIFAGSNVTIVNVRGTYTLEFEQVADEMEFGFAATGATGNWLAVDNFRLEYIGENITSAKSELADMIERSQSLLMKRMNTEVQQRLETAIAEASTCLQNLISSGATHVDSATAAATTELEAAYNAAQTSIAAFFKLNKAINAAQEELNSSSATITADYQAAITTAQAIYDNAATTDEQAEAAIAPLNEATFAFRVANGSGTAPKVETDPRFIRGCTWAFGRSTVSGTDIVEQGFCWSENPDPKVTDFRTTEYLNQAGRIYWLRDLKPATIYYIRAYAISSTYAVGYGDVLKVVTLPKGKVGHWYNNGGDEETNDRINYAINLSMDYYWNNLTSIHGFGISVTYSPGTPTADCNYGGSMRVGASSSYQQPGTIMHEALHGIGVGTHGNWWSGDYRPNGVWAGDRVMEALRFWDNNTTTVLNGDDMHMWPYGCNGAHEDTHSDNLYCMMGILAQALNEDGLPGSGEIGYALPYYAFNHEDDVKYYIKNEDANRGLHSAYLVETANHQLQWKTMDAEDAAADDAAAWYITFTPDNQYYQLRNAATGYYITYSGGFKTVQRTKPTTGENIHLMRGRVDVEGYRGYYMIHPESSSNPPTLVANTLGKTASEGWNIANSATTQRWLILTGKEAEQFDNGNLDLAREELDKLLKQIRKLAQTPHEETVEGADEQLATKLEDIESQAASATKGIEVEQLTEQARAEGMTFLGKVAATDIEQPFDLTFLLVNPNFTSSSTEGWTTNQTPGYEVGCDEFYERTFNFYQTLNGMPIGVYQLRAQAFQRTGDTKSAFARYKAGTEKITTSIYINSTNAQVKSIFDDRQPTQLYVDGGASDIKLTDNTYVPCVMKGGATYFAQGLYDNAVNVDVTTSNSTLRVGIKCTSAPSMYWTFFDNFRLYFFGGNKTLVGINTPTLAPIENKERGSVYDLSGRKIANSRMTKGLYIVYGKKLIVR